MTKKKKKIGAPLSQRSIDYIRARPWVRRQLGEAPNLALFWRDGPADSRQGMLWVLSSCANPECPCRDVFVEAITVADSLVLVELKGEGIKFNMCPDPDGLAGPYVKLTAFATIDVVAGRVSPNSEKPSDAELLGWLKAELDEPVLASLRVTWNKARGKPGDAPLPQERP